MIWKKKHISERAQDVKQYLRKQINKQPALLPELPFDNQSAVGIIGGGPKGFYALERLVTQIQQEVTSEPVQVYWFNETDDFASGPNYQVDQADYLLINYCVGNIDAWNREDVNPLVHKQLDLTDWLREEQIAEKNVEPTDYASRAVVGVYLQNQLKVLLENLPPQVELHVIVGRIVSVTYEDRFVLAIGEHADRVVVDQLLLATGHCYVNKPLLHDVDKLDHLPKSYFGSAYPVNKLDAIPAAKTVGIIGLGLTFIDTVLQLTEGRGGQFTDTGTYIPTGEEPAIYAFSRNNIPILPRGPIYGENHYRLREQTIQAFLELAETKAVRKIDFETEIFPLLQEEAQYAYYSTLLQTADEALVYKHINSLPANEAFRLEDLLFPAHPPVADGAQDPVLAYLEDCLMQAALGERQSPLLAASAVWRESTTWIGQIYAHAGFTADSQALFDHKLWGAFCRTSFGPPVENMKKVVALAKAGILRFTTQQWTAITYDAKTSRFLLTNEHAQQEVEYLVDARIARSKLSDVNAPLYASLLDNCLIEPFANEGYQPGGPALGETGQAVCSQRNRRIPLFFYGTATEGVLLDNDSLSRKRNDTASSWAKHVINNLKQIQNDNIHESYS